MEKINRLIEELNFNYPGSGWTLVIRGAIVDEDDGFVMDAAIYTSFPHVVHSDKVAPFPISECINIQDFDELVTELYNDLTDFSGVVYPHLPTNKDDE